jgi:hypothetical protein
MLRSDLPIELPFQAIVGATDAQGLDLDQAPADLAYFIAPFRCEVLLAGAVVTETCAGSTTTPVVKFDKRASAGNDSPTRGDGDIAELKFLTTANGKVIYDKVAVGTVLEPGQEVVVELTIRAVGGSPAGHCRPFLLVGYLPETSANLTNAIETT